MRMMFYDKIGYIGQVLLMMIYDKIGYIGYIGQVLLFKHIYVQCKYMLLTSSLFCFMFTMVKFCGELCGTAGLCEYAIVKRRAVVQGCVSYIYACWSIVQLFSICLHRALKRSVVVQGCVWNHSSLNICILPVHQLCNYLIGPAISDHVMAWDFDAFNEHHLSWEAMLWCCNWMKLINPMPANTTNSVRPSGRGLCNIRCTAHWEVDLSVTSSKLFQVMVEIICSLLF